MGISPLSEARLDAIEARIADRKPTRKTDVFDLLGEVRLLRAHLAACRRALEDRQVDVTALRVRRADVRDER